MLPGIHVDRNDSSDVVEEEEFGFHPRILRST